MTTPDDLFCDHEGECPDAGGFEDADRLFWQAVAYLLLGGLVLGGLTVLAWVARAWMLEPAVRGWR